MPAFARAFFYMARLLRPISIVAIERRLKAWSRALPQNPDRAGRESVVCKPYDVFVRGIDEIGFHFTGGVCPIFFSYLLHHAISNCLTLSLSLFPSIHPLTAADAIRRNSYTGKRNQNKTRDVGISCFSVVLVVESKSPDHAVLCYTVGYNCFCRVSRRRNTIPTTTRRQTYVCGEACFNSVPGSPLISNQADKQIIIIGQRRQQQTPQYTLCTSPMLCTQHQH